MGAALGTIFGNWLFGRASIVICVIALVMVLGNK
jgi:hypothetical protein